MIRCAVLLMLIVGGAQAKNATKILLPEDVAKVYCLFVLF